MNQEKKKSAEIAIIIIFLIIFAIELFYLIYNSICSVNVYMTNMSTKVIYDLANGVNPYGKEWLDNTSAVPVTYYESGFFHIFPAVLMMKIGLSVYTASAVTNIIYVIITMLVAAITAYAYSKNLTLSLLISSVSYFVINSRDFTVGRPDTLCTIIVFLILYLIYKDNENPKSINDYLIAFLCVLQVFLKIHYGSIVVAVIFYYFMKGFKRFLALGIKAAVITGLMLAFTQLLFPTFLSVFGVRVLYMLKLNAGDSDIIYLMKKWLKIVLKYMPFVIIMLVGHAVTIKKIFKDSIIGFLFVNNLFNIIGLCFMGMWQGNGLAYFEVMLTPSLLISSVYFVQLGLNELKVKDKKKLANILLSVFILLSFVLALISNNVLYKNFSSIKESKEARNEMMIFLDKYQDEELLLSPRNSWYSLLRGRYQWDYGDQIYMPFDIGTSPRWNFLFPYTNKYRGRMTEYASSMVDKINNKEYALIEVINDNVLGLNLGLESAFEEAIENNYKLQQFDVGEFYIPK